MTLSSLNAFEMCDFFFLDSIRKQVSSKTFLSVIEQQKSTSKFVTLFQTIMSNENGTSEELSSSGHGLGETDTSENLESVLRECEELFENEKEWEAHVHGILKDTITKFQSMEGGAKYKYKKLMEIRDLLLSDRKELKAKIQVTLMNTYSQLLFVRPSDLSENS